MKTLPKTSGNRSVADDEPPRSRTARAAAEAALVRVVRHYGARAELVVLDGLVPELLCSTAPVRHAGTTDIDVQVDLEIASGPVQTARLERALRNAEFEPNSERVWRRPTSCLDGLLRSRRHPPRTGQSRPTSRPPAKASSRNNAALGQVTEARHAGDGPANTNRRHQHLDCSADPGTPPPHPTGTTSSTHASRSHQHQLKHAPHARTARSQTSPSETSTSRHAGRRWSERPLRLVQGRRGARPLRRGRRGHRDLTCKSRLRPERAGLPRHR